MSTHKHIDKICLVAAVLALILCAVFMGGESFGIQAADRVMGYENRLFDTGKVHNIDIVIDDWEGFLQTARSEEYSVCSVVIDGEAVTNVGIRGKGNTSLSNVASMNSQRYSFKIEFDQYDNSKTYHGLDKLSLNNVIQDNTYMKDYLTYQMMGQMGAPAPLCSYAWITVNGEDWGLYLAVEAVEDSFLQRNYGSDYGELYKPDSMNMGGGRGNGKDFDMSQFLEQQEEEGADVTSGATTSSGAQGNRGNRGGMTMPGGMQLPEGMTMPGGMQFPGDFSGASGKPSSGADFTPGEMPDMGNFGGFGGFGMGSSVTKLQYIDDDPASYSTIFDSAKTDITDADKKRLIASLKQLSAYENLPEVVNVDDVLRYFVVHNYVVNGDSYTGSMIHNYYLYEENGQLSMIPWDYNLAFGTFMGGNGASSVNDDIDEVLSDRPMQAWIFSDETYRQQYYALYAQLLEQVDVQGIINSAYTLIAPYVEKDPTAFCTYNEFQTGVETMKAFCRLRSESVRLQLNGSTETVSTGTLDLSAMGSMGGGMGGFGGKDFGSRDDSDTSSRPSRDESTQQSNTQTMPEGMQMPGGMSGGFSGGFHMPEGMTMPEGMQMPGGMSGGFSGGFQMPEGMTMPEGMQMPGGMSGGFSGGFQMPNFQLPGSSNPTATQPTQGNEANDATEPAPSKGSGSKPTSGEMPNFGNMGGFGGMSGNVQSAASGTETLMMLGVSALFLAFGLVVAFAFKRRQ